MHAHDPQQSCHTPPSAGPVKCLVLYSGGLDSVLAVRLLQAQGLEVEGVFFINPFGTQRMEAVRASARELGLPLHVSRMDRAYLRLVADPPHGYGKNMNPCVDCRIYTFRCAWRLAIQIGARFLATGEVPGQRPFSQTMHRLMQIEGKADLAGWIVRPLSARLLAHSKPERAGWVHREGLLDIRGRSRKRQLALAERLGIEGYSMPAGGCLLTERHFSRKLEVLLERRGRIDFGDVELLRLGRHYRYGCGWIITGRNEAENQRLFEIAQGRNCVCLEARTVPGAITLVDGDHDPDVIEQAARITARHSKNRGHRPLPINCRRKGQTWTLWADPLDKAQLESLHLTGRLARVRDG